MISDYELILPKDLKLGDWIKTPKSPLPSLLLDRHARAFVIANFDNDGRPTSAYLDAGWDVYGVPIPRLSAAHMQFGDTAPVAKDWVSPFAYVMYEVGGGKDPVLEPMVKVDPGESRDAYFFGLRTGTGRGYSPSHQAPIHEFRLWASIGAMERGEDPLIHYKT